jgi:hypothetical protein
MLELTAEEIDLLRELAMGPRQISGTRTRAGLTRLVDAYYVHEQPVTRGDTSVITYEITDIGRVALEAGDWRP